MNRFIDISIIYGWALLKNMTLEFRLYLCIGQVAEQFNFAYSLALLGRFVIIIDECVWLKINVNVPREKNIQTN